MGEWGIRLLIALRWVLDIYTYIILADVILSWVPLSPYNRLVRTVHFLSEPLMAPCRALMHRIIPPGRIPLDFSPVLAMLAIQAVSWFVMKVIVYLLTA